jgi:hypothetical protein
MGVSLVLSGTPTTYQVADLLFEMAVVGLPVYTAMLTV